MPLTKDYQRFVPEDVFGVITSPDCNVALIPDKNKQLGTLCVSGACEHVIIWNIQTGEQINRFSASDKPVTRIAWSYTTQDVLIAAGYADGWVRVFSAWTEELVTSYRGHSADISALYFDRQMGDKLACGSKDTSITVLDLVSESGYRLKGHKSPVTQVYISHERNILFSSSMDTFIKLWDLSTQHCFKTITGHPAAIWDFILTKNDSLLITGSSDSDLRIWQLNYCKNQTSDSETSGSTDIVSAVYSGSVRRESTKRIFSMVLEPSGNYFVCQTNEKKVEIYCLLNQDEIKKRKRKRHKKAQSKDEPLPEWSLCDEIKRIAELTLPSQTKFVDVFGSPGKLNCLCGLNNNSLEMYRMILVEKTSDLTLLNRVGNPGHRSEVLDCSVTSDGLGIFTLSGSEAKLWSRTSQKCLVTLDWSSENTSRDKKLGRATVGVLAAGDRHVVLGFESGVILLINVASKSILQKTEAHQGSVRGLCLTSDKKGIISGSIDKTVVFWKFDLESVPVPETNSTQTQLCLKSHQIKTEADGVRDGVTCLKCSPNGRFLAVAMLNFQVRVFFVDTFKKMYDLYGHSQTVDCIAISSDSTLLMTGSGDKTVRIWGLQFGNCQKTFTTHRHMVTGVDFLPKSLLAFSCDSGGKIKLWDAEKFREIITLTGHSGLGASCIASASTGGFVVTGGKDKSIRTWQKSEELVVLEEEEEIEREKQYEEEELTKEVEPNVEGEEIGVVTKKTGESLRGAEQLLEALEIYQQQTAIIDGTKPPLHPLMLAYQTPDPERFILATLSRIKVPELEQSLLSLPRNSAMELLARFSHFLKEGWEVELISRCLLILFNLHGPSIILDSGLLHLLNEINKLQKQGLKERKELVGFNLAALDYMKMKLEQNDDVVLFDEIKSKRDRRKKRKSTFVLTR